MSKPLKIYLCDLTYDTIILVSDTIPINIGFVGSYLRKQFGEIQGLGDLIPAGFVWCFLM